jgi:hypothetical protein
MSEWAYKQAVLDALGKYGEGQANIARGAGRAIVGAAQAVAPPTPEVPLVARTEEAPSRMQPAHSFVAKAEAAPPSYAFGAGVSAANAATREAQLNPPPPGEAPPVHAQGPAQPMGADMRPVVEGPQAFRVAVPGSAAREVSLYGPTQRAAIAAADAVNHAANNAIMNRSVAQAAVEEATTFQQAQDALAVVEQQKVSAQRRQQEAEARLADMDKTVKEVSRMSVDPNRFWSNMGTGQRIAVQLGWALSGSFSGHDSVGPMIQAAIDRDIAAQRFAAETKLKKFDAQKSAYGMLLDKYQSVDAATNLMRASMLDAVAAQTRQMGAQQKNVDAQNKAEAMAAQFGEQARDYVLKGLQYVQASGPSERYMVMRGGVPVAMSKAEYLAYQDKRDAATDTAAEKAMDRDLKREEVRDKRGDQVGQETRFIAEKMQGADVPGALAAAEEARRTIAANTPGYAERALRAAAGKSEIGQKAANVVGGTDKGVTAAERQQALATFRNRAMKVIAGNVTESEERRIEAGLSGTGSPEEQMNGIKQAEQAIEAIQKNIMAGVSPEAQRIYSQRRDAATTPASAAPAGARKGW